MFIPILIPIGRRHVATLRGAVWKFVNCEHCQKQYAYLLELEATGKDHDLLFLDGEGSAERARAQAAQNFLQQSRNRVRPIPCPYCGFYQAEMAQQLKEEKWINPFQICGALIVLLSFIPLAFEIANIWVATLVLAGAGLALLAYGYVLTFRFDPNAGDPEPRKVVGQSHAGWGAELAELLSRQQSAQPDAPPDQPGN